MTQDDSRILRVGKLSRHHGVYGTAHPLTWGHLCVGTYRKAKPEFVCGNGRRGDRVDAAQLSTEQSVGGRDCLGLRPQWGAAGGSRVEGEGYGVVPIVYQGTGRVSEDCLERYQAGNLCRGVSPAGEGREDIVAIPGYHNRGGDNDRDEGYYAKPFHHPTNLRR